MFCNRLNVKCRIYGFVVISIFLPVITANAETSTVLSEADFLRIDTYIDTQLKEANIPGAALVIVEKGKITHLRSFGISGPDGQQVTAETGFVLGSVTKSFTALAIMQLVETGMIDLDAPVQKYLPWFRVADPEASSQMKVRHLLNHTSGFSTYSGRTHFTSRNNSDKAIEQRVRDLHKSDLTHPVGKGTYYSNSNYSILGAIIESVSGQSYEDYIQEHIFDPLDMTSSYTSVEEAKQNGLATGYRYWFGKPIAATDIPCPRGDIAAIYLFSCAKDMGNYLITFMDGGVFEDTRILSKRGVSKIHTPDKGRTYAMGWWIGKHNGTRIINHGGETPNFVTEMAIFPEHQRAFAILINANNWFSGPAIRILCWNNVRSVIMGDDTPPIMKAPKIHTGLALLCGFIFVQVICFIIAIRRIYRWKKHPDTRPAKKLWLLYTRSGLSLIINSTIAVGTLWLIPQSRELPFSLLMLCAPDAGWLLLLSGTLALIMFIISAGVMVFLIRQSRQSKATTAKPIEGAASMGNKQAQQALKTHQKAK